MCVFHDKIIVLDNSDDDVEAQEEKTAGIESMTAPASVDPALSAPTSADDAPAGAKIGNSVDQGPTEAQHIPIRHWHGRAHEQKGVGAHGLS
jgi:hypothetical protein